ncbi:hypothetical protein HETIRDRAFT_311075 [Heterobasidion irregulare TC 32-1]|uniref:Uncharacterized protein n=1 Tax=Heterobasidion irregulare (strain TC 32-1) TaxID=747525 RepID=W4KIV2_HETIT|nr:uncharacterized protein HETIRDRAFT_311075 [Heterobasidion irregulare TC 32-1]ETW84991.1 hypothetical protein HETIRDRAFT_311075 [Heterobasidion irregulare TC 32-1]
MSPSTIYPSTLPAPSSRPLNLSHIRPALPSDPLDPIARCTALPALLARSHAHWPTGRLARIVHIASRIACVARTHARLTRISRSTPRSPARSSSRPPPSTTPTRPPPPPPPLYLLRLLRCRHHHHPHHHHHRFLHLTPLL